MNWYVQEKKRGAWKTVEVIFNSSQHDAEQIFFRKHFGHGRLTNEDNSVIVYVPQGKEEE